MEQYTTPQSLDRKKALIEKEIERSHAEQRVLKEQIDQLNETEADYAKNEEEINALNHVIRCITHNRLPPLFQELRLIEERRRELDPKIALRAEIEEVQGILSQIAEKITSTTSKITSAKAELARQEAIRESLLAGERVLQANFQLLTLKMLQ